MRLKERCDPANAFESYEQDAHTLEVCDARSLPQDADILLPGSAGFKVVSHVCSITDWLNEELLSSTYHDEVFAGLRKFTGAEHIFLGGPLKVLPWVVEGAGGLGAGKTSGAGTRGVSLDVVIGGRTGDTDTNGGESSDNRSKVHADCGPAENPSL